MSATLLQHIRSNVIGQYQPLQTPYGSKPLVYADYTASGRALRFVEAQIQHKVLPYYANTHSESSLTGAQTTALREQARRTIADALGCSERDRVIFCGSGATAAINKLIDILNLRLPRDLDQRYALADQIPAEQRPVVFVGPYEHHSNELPWRETIAELVAIPLDTRGHIDQVELAAALRRFAHRPLRIGSFSAASNVTGIRSDVEAITRLLKEHHALACWDYAAAGPYVAIDMNRPAAEIDAVFLSPHKFIGGPGTPGVLALKAGIAENTVPAVVGGGTVAYVSPHRHRYLDDIERREEGGTPGIVESIRAGLVVGLQQAVGTANIERLEKTRTRAAQSRLAPLENLQILGETDDDQLAIFSLRVHHQARDLHYGFVVALLNDLFGIQARGGCSCAGPYGHSLLDIDAERSDALEALVVAGYGAMRPGWLRLNFNYFISDAEFDYLLSALALVASLGWRLLPDYHMDPRNGLWRHRNASEALPVKLDPTDVSQTVIETATTEPDFSALLREAQAVLERGANPVNCLAAAQDPQLSEEAESRRWFVLPAELADAVHPTLAQAV